VWIVRLAVNRPHTSIVASILILIFGFGSIATAPTDIFSTIDIPQVTVVWTYSGQPANETEQRVPTFSEFSMAVVNAEDARKQDKWERHEWKPALSVVVTVTSSLEPFPSVPTSVEEMKLFRIGLERRRCRMLDERLCSIVSAWLVEAGISGLHKKEKRVI
jgi:hypothetical protein